MKGEERMETVSLSDWLLEKITVDSLWARKALLREAKMALAVLVCSVDGLETPSEGEAVYLSNGRKAAQNLDGILSAIAALDAGVPPDQILLPLWGPREEEATEEVKPEVEPTVEPIGETLLTKLGLSTRVYNALCRSGALLEPLGLVVVDSEGRKTLKREPYAEEVLGVLDARGEKFFLGFKNFGEKALEELEEKLQEHGFLPAEEPGERELIETLVSHE